MEIVNDIDRPDVNGVAPKMQGVCDDLRAKLEDVSKLKYLSVWTNDNLCSSVTVRASLDEKGDWANNIFQNSRYIILTVHVAKGKRYYEEGDKVTVEMISKKYSLPNMRKYTGTPDKVVQKIVDYVQGL